MSIKETEKQEIDAVDDKTELYELDFSDILHHRKQIKAAVGTANVVTGDQVKALKVKPAKAKS